ncbi:hypothetical protein ABFA07_010899 [Porites harrisoni]
MSSSEEFSDTSGEEYLSDDSECLDFEEIETEERVNQELLSESSTAVKETDSELQAYMDEPLADEEWIKNYRQQEAKNKQEELLKKQLADKTRTGEWCQCGNCSQELLKNISECYCCQELDGCVKAMASDLVLEALPEGQKISCITDHPGFKTVVLDKWSLRMAVSRFNTKEKKTYKQTGSEERLMRVVAYRQFSRLVYEFLGKKRIPLPACAYTIIRRTYPLQDNEELTGFDLVD